MHRDLPQLRHHRLAARLMVVLICCLVLPGCLTTMLWEGESTTVSEMVPLGEDVEQTTGSLELADVGLLFGSSDGVQLWAEPLGPNGELVTALLADSDHCEVFAATLERVFIVSDGQVLKVDSSVEIRVRLRPDVSVESLPKLDVDPSLRAWMVGHLMADPVGVHRAKVELEEGTGSLTRRDGAVKVQSDFVQKFTRYKRVEVEEESLSVWAKIAFTPVTLTIDLVFSIFWAWLSSEIDDDDDDEASGLTFADHPSASERK